LPGPTLDRLDYFGPNLATGSVIDRRRNIREIYTGNAASHGGKWADQASAIDYGLPSAIRSEINLNGDYLYQVMFLQAISSGYPRYRDRNA
jgi:hypothetical protein